MGGKTLLLMSAGLLVLLSGIAQGQAGNVSALFEQAGKYSDDANYSAAEAIYKQITAEYTQTRDALKAQERLTILYIEQDKAEQADAAFDEMVAVFAGFEGLPKAVDHVGDAYRRRGNYDKAVQRYRYVAETWPEAEQAVHSQGSVICTHILRKDEQAAEAAIEKLFTDFSDAAGLEEELHYQASRCAVLNNYGMARHLYQVYAERCAADEGAVWANVGIAGTSVVLGDSNEVEAALDKFSAEYAPQVNSARLTVPLRDFCRYLLKLPAEKQERVEAFIGDKLLRDIAGKDEAGIVDHIGDFYRDTMQYDKAAEVFESIAQLWPDSERAVESQANIVKMYISIADEPNATAYFDKLISKFGQSAGIAAAVENVAQEYLELRNTQKAYEKFGYIVEHWPGSERAIWAKTGMVMSRIRGLDLEAGESELLELLEGYSQDKDLPAGVHEIVEEYRNVGAYTEGREVFEYLLENPFEGPGTMLELQVGIVLQSIKLGEPNKADAAIDKLIADYNDHPNLAKGLFQIGEQHFYARNYWKTIELLEVIQSDYRQSNFGARSEVPFVLATCYKHGKEWDKAIEYYAKTIEEYPTSRYASWAPYNLGWIYMHMKVDYAKALYWFGRQRKLYPDDSYASCALFSIGCIYVHRLKNYEKGAEVCQQYVDEYPEGVDVWGSLSNLATCHEHLGNTKKAIGVLWEAHRKARSENLRGEVMQRIERLQEGDAK